MFTLACRQGKNGALAVFFQVYTTGKTLARAVARRLECSDAELFSAPMVVLVEQIHAGHSCEAHQCFCWNKKRFLSKSPGVSLEIVSPHKAELPVGEVPVLCCTTFCCSNVHLPSG